MRTFWILVAVALLAGCSSNQPAPAPPTEPDTHQTSQEPPKTEDPLYTQIHSGLFQADAAVKKISDALDLAREIQGKVTGDMAQPMKDMVQELDKDGSSLQDSVGGEPPTEEQVKQSPAKYQGQRDLLVDEINKVLKSIREQAGVADNLDQPAVKTSAAKLGSLFDEIIDDLVGARTALGGKEPELQDTPDTGDTNQQIPGFNPNSAGTTTGGG
ncbi:MAG TPA: hypothetical protein VHE55_13425 [Fimbriimonadaceae bacterium]|nr:hypothetical protein [Fimbriimonadaceae bacterium]